MRGKISISLGKLFKKYDVMETLEIAKKIGAEAVDFYLASQDYRKENSIFSKSEDEICEYYTKVRKKADELGLVIGQTHGFYPPVKKGDDEYNNIVSPKNTRLDCMATKILGAPICVFHPVGFPDNLNASSEYMYSKTFEYIKIIPTVSKDSSYITRHKNARGLIEALDFDQLNEYITQIKKHQNI